VSVLLGDFGEDIRNTALDHAAWTTGGISAPAAAGFSLLDHVPVELLAGLIATAVVIVNYMLREQIRHWGPRMRARHVRHDASKRVAEGRPPLHAKSRSLN
jgi:hypothetical protein